MFNAQQQRWLKTLHIASAGVWLGALTSIVLLHFLGPASSEARERFGLDLAAYQIHEQLLFWAFVITLCTGLLFSLFTKWGFFVHYWLIAKWALALCLFALTLWFQSPALSGVVALSDAGLSEFNGQSYQAYRSQSSTLALSQLAIVVFIFGISTLKPWGRRQSQQGIVSKQPFPRVWLLGGVGTAAAVGIALSVFGYLNLRTYRNLAIEDVNIATLKDGLYQGSADCGFEYQLELGVRDGRLSTARVLRNRDAHYARIAEAVLTRVERRQSLQVDAITGATTTSKCLLRAAQNALTGAAVPVSPAPIPSTSSRSAQPTAPPN